MPYSETFKDHIVNPRNAGELAGANAIAEETNPVCGDRLRLSLLISADRIEAARLTLEAQDNLSRSEQKSPLGEAMLESLGLQLSQEVAWMAGDQEDDLPNFYLRFCY